MHEEKPLIDRVFWKVVQTDSWSTGCFKRGFGNAAIQPLLAISMNLKLDEIERSKAMRFLADFGVKVVPLLLDALKNAKTPNVTRCDILATLEKIGEIEPLPPEAFDAIIGLISHPTLGQSAAKALETLANQMATDIRRIICDRDHVYAAERGSQVVASTISAVIFMAGGQLTPKTAKTLSSFYDEVKKQEQRMKLRGAKDGETVRVERPLRSRAKSREQIPAHQGRRAFAGG